MNAAAKYTAAEKHKSVLRELAFRRTVYARRVEMRTMTQVKADFEIGIMQAIVDDYRKLAEVEDKAGRLI